MTTKQLREMERQAGVLEQNPQMTRKEATTIMKKYEKNGMIGWKGTFPKQEYFIAKQRYNQIVKEQNISK